MRLKMTCMSLSLDSRPFRLLALCGFLSLSVCALAARPVFGQEQLNQIRSDVRNNASAASSGSSPSSGSRDSCRPQYKYHSSDDSLKDSVTNSLSAPIFTLGIAVAAVPYWVPIKFLGDDFSVIRDFTQFPYEDEFGYMTLNGGKRWSAQFSSDYATEFNDLDQIGGRLLVDTASRWGVDTEMKYFQETVPRAARDSLWLGDCNLTFRFAKSENMQWRTGLGFNWMDDPGRSDFGFNFTYGFDWFPRKPWVVSAEIDLGTLGHSSLFHFRGTVGAMFDRFEAYTGYEYYDFDNVQTNMLIGGVRIWF